MQTVSLIRCHKKVLDGFYFGGLWWLGLHITVLWRKTVSTFRIVMVHIQQHVLSVWGQILFTSGNVYVKVREPFNRLAGTTSHLPNMYVFWSSGRLLYNNITVVLSVILPNQFVANMFDTFMH